MSRTTLGTFLKLVPTYSAATLVTAWLEHWSGVATVEGWVMVIDAWGCPQALLNGWAVLAQVLQHPELKPLTLGSEILQAWAIAMMPVRADLGVGEWFATKATGSGKGEIATALVSLDGQYLGLLDLPAVIHYFAQQFPNPEQHSSLGIAPELLRAWESLSWPVLIQTGDGEALWHNEAWKNQLGQDGIKISPTGEIQGHLLWAGQRHTSRWQFYPLPLSTDGHILATAMILKTQPELLPALCLTGLGTAMASSLQPNPLTQVTLWIVLGLELPDTETQTSQLAANLTALRQRYQGQQDFLASLNHELKNPVTSVLSLSQLLQQTDFKQRPTRQQDYLDQIERSCRQLSYVLTEWLELSQAQQGNLELTWEPLRLRLLLEQAQDWLRQRPQIFTPEFSPTAIGQRLEAFEVWIEPGLEVISGDKLRVRQILGHLITALLWLNHQDQSSEFQAWGLIAKQGTRWHELKLWQMGVGIPLVEQITLLETLGDRGKMNTTVGLGLILARQLIRLHGGELSLWATDAECPGRVEFSILWPASLEQSSTLVLLYGHNPAGLTALANTLAQMGYLTAVARQDLELLDKSRQLQPQAILIEPHLYQAGGELLFLGSLRHLLTATPETNAIPLITWSQSEPANLPPGVHLLTESDTWPNDPGLGALLQQLEMEYRNPLNALPPAVKAAPTVPESTRVLTVLRLGTARAFTPQLHRFLEADDLEQGQLLAEIWQPDILLWDLPLPSGLSELASLGHYPLLARLPLVTLNEQITRQAYQIPGVMVYPCLDVALLGQVIERAWRHSII